MEAYVLDVTPLKKNEKLLLNLLPPKRREKALACAREEDRLQQIGAGLLLSHVLGVTRDEDLVENEYGAPRLAFGSPCFSLSHSGKFVLLAVSMLPVGADIQKIQPVRPGLLQRMATAEELESGIEFFTLFTRKEAMMKATGLGFSLLPKSFSVVDPLTFQGETYYFHTFQQEGYVLSFAGQEKQPPVFRELSLNFVTL